MSKKYQERANELLAVMHIAERITKNSKSIPNQSKQAYFDTIKEISSIINSKKKEYQNIAGLKSAEEVILTQWNEGTGEDVELFWEEIAKKGINYTRKDVFKDILERKKIKNIHEYHVVIDGLVVAQQTSKISTEEANLISSYIGEFEKKNAGKY